jgi:hypothetical protein
MPEWQNDIYFISGETLEAVKKSPFMEIANKKNIEVLYLIDPMDECESASKIAAIIEFLSVFDYHFVISLNFHAFNRCIPIHG